MLHPTIDELTQGKFNRYALVIATAKCARIVTDEYVKQREVAEKILEDKDKKSDKTLASMIDKDIRDNKAVENAVQRLYKGEFTVIVPEEATTEQLK